MSSVKKSSIDNMMSMLAREFDSIEKITIYQDGNGFYHLFKKYTIQKCDNSFSVARNKSDSRKFNSLKNAVGWCIADKYGKIDLAHSLQHTDMFIEYTKTSIHHMKHTANTTSDLFKHAVLNDRIDFEEKRLRRLQYVNDKNISDAKYTQARGLLNETSRI